MLRYTTHFKQVLLCRRKGLANGDIAFATKLSLRLIEEYQGLIEAWGKQHPHWECSGQPWLDDLIAQLEKTIPAPSAPATKTVTPAPNSN